MRCMRKSIARHIPRIPLTIEHVDPLHLYRISCHCVLENNPIYWTLISWHWKAHASSTSPLHLYCIWCNRVFENTALYCIVATLLHPSAGIHCTGTTYCGTGRSKTLRCIASEPFGVPNYMLLYAPEPLCARKHMLLTAPQPLAFESNAIYSEVFENPCYKSRTHY